MAYLLMETAKSLVLLRDAHTAEVERVPNCLEVAADEEEVNGVFVSFLEFGDPRIDRVQLAVAASFDCDLRVSFQDEAARDSGGIQRTAPSCCVWVQTLRCPWWALKMKSMMCPRERDGQRAVTSRQGRGLLKTGAKKDAPRENDKPADRGFPGIVWQQPPFSTIASSSTDYHLVLPRFSRWLRLPLAQVSCDV